MDPVLGPRYPRAVKEDAMTLAEFQVPASLLAEIQAAADGEHRRAEDLIQEALETFLAERDWRVRDARETARAQEAGLPDDRGLLTGEYRSNARTLIAEGLADVRAGRLQDGDAVFAGVFEEMDELDRRDRG